VLLEAIRQPLVLVHRSHPSFAGCQRIDPHDMVDVTPGYVPWEERRHRWIPSW
jgi:hypothetical protein